MELQQLIDEVAAKLLELYTAFGAGQKQVGAAYTALTGKVPPDESEVAALTSEVKTSVDDIEASVRDSQQP